MDGEGLEGPNKYHVYIGFAKNNKTTVLHLQAQLQRKNVICCRRADDDVKKSITDGVSSSQKCVIFLTFDYIKDDWFKIETEEMIEKTELFSRDTLLILNTDPAIIIPDSLAGFKIRSFNSEKLTDEKYVATLVDQLRQEPNLELSILPKKNIGYASAFGYFYGYLRLVLPEFRYRLEKETLGSEPHLMANTIKKMLIIIPESCFCPPSLEIDGKIEFTGKFVIRVGNRAGNKQRDYKSSLFKLIDKERQEEEYYFVGELATPLLTMYESYYYGLSRMTREQLYMERDGFYFALKSILSHPDNAECNDQFKILYWSDPETNKPNQLDIYDFLLPVLRKELDLQRENERNALKYPATHNAARGLSLQISEERLNSFEEVKVPGSNPSSIYETVERYNMDQRPRGQCLIINIANFDKGHVHLKQRKGSERDREIMTKLFEDLHFEVSVHNDVNASTLETLLLTMNVCNHSRYDAFVCCILTHGKLGVIYTSDGKPVEILEIVNYFADRQCPSLKGKPKLFFIQACQKGDSESENNSNQSENSSNQSENSSNRAFSHDGISNSQSQTDTNHGSCQDIKKLQLSDNRSLDEDAAPDPIMTTFKETPKALKKDASKAPTMTTLDAERPAALTHKAVLVPGAPDFLMSYSTLPGSISYRDTITGSLYIQALDECLRKGQEIDRALKQVSSRVRQKLEERGVQDGIKDRFQLPFHLTSGMDRLIYL